MALETAKAYLEERGYGDRIQVFDVSSATVELAAISGCKGWINVCSIPEE